MAPFTALATEVQQRIFKLAVSTSEASEVYAVTPDQMQRLAIGKAKHSQRYNTAMAILLVNKQFGSAVFVAIQQHCLEVSKELTRMNEWLPLAWIMLNKANSDLGQTILEMPELMQTGMLNATSAKRAGCFTPTQVERYEQVYRAWDSREKIVPMLRIRKWNLWYERDCEMSPLIEWFAGRKQGRDREIQQLFRNWFVAMLETTVDDEVFAYPYWRSIVRRMNPVVTLLAKQAVDEGCFYAA